MKVFIFTLLVLSTSSFSKEVTYSATEKKQFALEVIKKSNSFKKLSACYDSKDLECLKNAFSKDFRSQWELFQSRECKKSEEKCSSPTEAEYVESIRSLIGKIIEIVKLGKHGLIQDSSSTNVLPGLNLINFPMSSYIYIEDYTIHVTDQILVISAEYPQSEC